MDENKTIHSETLDGIEQAIDRYESEPTVKQESQAGFNYTFEHCLDVRTSIFTPVKYGAFGMVDSKYSFARKSVWMTKKGQRERVELDRWGEDKHFADTPENREIFNKITEIEKSIKELVEPLKAKRDELFESLTKIKPTIEEDKLPSWS
jgi:hypothetical protein